MDYAKANIALDMLIESAQKGQYLNSREFERRFNMTENQANDLAESIINKLGHLVEYNINGFSKWNIKPQGRNGFDEVIKFKADGGFIKPFNIKSAAFELTDLLRAQPLYKCAGSKLLEYLGYTKQQTNDTIDLLEQYNVVIAIRLTDAAIGRYDLPGSVELNKKYLIDEDIFDENPKFNIDQRSITNNLNNSGSITTGNINQGSDLDLRNSQSFIEPKVKQKTTIQRIVQYIKDNLTTVIVTAISSTIAIFIAHYLYKTYGIKTP